MATKNILQEKNRKSRIIDNERKSAVGVKEFDLLKATYLGSGFFSS